jgi:hypothetical protein
MFHIFVSWIRNDSKLQALPFVRYLQSRIDEIGFIAAPDDIRTMIAPNGRIHPGIQGMLELGIDQALRPQVTDTHQNTSNCPPLIYFMRFILHSMHSPFNFYSS